MGRKKKQPQAEKAAEQVSEAAAKAVDKKDNSSENDLSGHPKFAKFIKSPKLKG